jgi:Flp pilus assembly protein TadG
MPSPSRSEDDVQSPSRLRSEQGQSIVEFAFVLPILLALVLGIVQFGIAFNNYLTITDATRVGARKAAVSRFLGDNGAAARTATYNAAAGLNAAKLVVDVTATSWTTPGSDVTVTATYPYSIDILGWVVSAGNVSSTTHERLE